LEDLLQQLNKLLKTTLENDTTIYGDGYRMMRDLKNQVGWIQFITSIKANYSY